MENGTSVCGLQEKGAAEVIGRVDQRRAVGRKSSCNGRAPLWEVNICSSRGGKKTEDLKPCSRREEAAVMELQCSA